MLSPFWTIDKAIEWIEQTSVAIDETRLNEKPENKTDGMFQAFFRKINNGEAMDLALKFNNAGIASAAGLYAELICGPTPSTGCRSCGFMYSAHGGPVRCQFCGECTPLSED